MAKARATPRKQQASTDGLDPRLIDLARYLARRAAERDYEMLRKTDDQPERTPAEGKEAT